MLGEALESVSGQTAPLTEIIVIDDCSEDRLELVTRYSPDLPLRFVRHLENRGPAASVVHGIREARCELIAILNHDDTWEPEFLDRLTGALDANPEACLAFCDHGIVRADGRRDERRSTEQSTRYARSSLHAGLQSGTRLYESALLDKAVAASSFALVRRDALDLALIGVGADMWDYFLVVGACRTGRPAAYVAERLGWYRISPTMLSATHADPRKRIQLVRTQVAILTVILRSRRLRPIHRPIRRRLGSAIARSLAVATRTRDPRNVARVASLILAGIGDAKRLSKRDHSIRPDRLPRAPEGHAQSSV